MEQYRTLEKFAIEVRENIRRLAEIARPYRLAMNDIIASIPKISFPKIEFPEFEIDWERIEAIINHNSSSGWTLTGEMGVSFYLDEDLLQLEQQQIDKLFVEYFESNSNKNYHNTKSVILGEVDEQWKSVLNDCFELFEQDKYRVIIPMLMSIIEGEVSDIANSSKVGAGLLRDWKKQISSEEERMMIIISYSLNKYLASKIFKYKEFHAERGLGINRNWVLHGRDNPENWTKVDALKLINVISTLQFIKNH